MKRLITLLPFVILTTLFSCEEDPYNDEQYGNHCYISKMETTDGQTTTFSYDQDDMINSIKTTGGNMPNTEVKFTYNNDMAFADFFLDGTLIGQSEATIDPNGDVITILFKDSTGSQMGEYTYNYDSNHRVILIEGYDFVNSEPRAMNIEWTNGNATRFSTDNFIHKCAYKTGKKTSLRIGKGNVFIQAQMADANIGFFLSQDVMESYDASSDLGFILYMSYDFDSDGKVRKMYWSTESTNNFWTTNIDYECYD